MAKYRKLGRTCLPEKSFTQKSGNSSAEQRQNRYDRSKSKGDPQSCGGLNCYGCKREGQF